MITKTVIISFDRPDGWKLNLTAMEWDKTCFEVTASMEFKTFIGAVHMPTDVLFAQRVHRAFERAHVLLNEVGK